MEVMLRLSQPIPCVWAGAIKEKRQDIVSGDPLLKGAEYPEWIHFFGKPAALLGAGSMIWRESFLPWYDPQVIIHYWFFQAGNDEAAARSSRSVKRDCWILAWPVKGSGAQLVLLSILPVVGNDEERNRKVQQTKPGIGVWYHQQNFGIFDN